MKNHNTSSRIITNAGLHLFITFAVMVVIFVHSAMPGDVSGAESNLFAQMLASLTGISMESASFVVRKAAHITEFAILGICLTVNMYDLKASRRVAFGSAVQSIEASETDHNDIDKPVTELNDTTKPIRLLLPPEVLAWILTTAYAATDEFHQLFVPDRSGNIRDVCIDAAGAALGVIISVILFEKQVHKSNSL